MLASRLFACGIALALGASCAHGQEASSGGEAERENAVLRERVLRLERRLSDLDAQVALLSEKVAEREASGESVSSGAPPATYAPAPASYAPERFDVARDDEWRPRSREPAAPRSIDLGPAPPRYEPRAELPDVEAAGPATAASTPATSLAAEPGPPRGNAQALYDWARARMQEGRYLEAVAGFDDVLELHGADDLGDNALYWMGECHLERGEPRLAIETWRTLPLRYPNSPKMPDSLYGMALSHEELGEPVLAETLYAQLIEQYPKAEKSAEAKKALKRLKGSPDAPR